MAENVKLLIEMAEEVNQSLRFLTGQDDWQNTLREPVDRLLKLSKKIHQEQGNDTSEYQCPACEGLRGSTDIMEADIVTVSTHKGVVLTQAGTKRSAEKNDVMNHKYHVGIIAPMNGNPQPTAMLTPISRQDYPKPTVIFAPQSILLAESSMQCGVCGRSYIFQESGSFPP